MIHLDVEPYCHDCSDFDPEVQRIYADGAVYSQTVTCEHIRHCRAICEYIQSHEEKGK